MHNVKLIIKNFMVDTNSPAFNFSEKIGFFIGKAIRYILICGVFTFIGAKLGGSTPSRPVANPFSP